MSRRDSQIKITEKLQSQKRLFYKKWLFCKCDVTTSLVILHSLGIEWLHITQISYDHDDQP